MYDTKKFNGGEILIEKVSLVENEIVQMKRN